MSVLDGISPNQVAAIVRLFQAGALRPAPPELSAPAPSLLLPAALQHEALEVQAAQYHQQTYAQEQEIDADKDEGEIEEIEPDNTMTGRGFLHPPPTGPRNPNANKRKPSPRPPIRTPPVYNEPESRPQQPPAPHVNGDVNGAAPENKDLVVKKFVLELVKEGYSFDAIAEAVGSPHVLAHLFTQMRLEVPAQYSSSAKAETNGNTTTKQPVKRPAPAKPAAPAKPIDRSEYLARLQAARNKKVDSTTVASAAPKVDNKPNDVAKPEAQSDQASSTNANPNNATAKAEVKTALVRQRLEALKAQHAAKQNAADVSLSSPVQKSTMLTSSNRQPASSPTSTSLGAGLEDAATRAAQMSSFESSQLPPTSMHPTQGIPSTQPVISPTPPTPTRSLGGLPGLFMFDQSTQVQQATPQATYPSPTTLQQPPAPFSSYKTNTMAQSSQVPADIPTTTPTGLSIPRKRPVASDFDYPTTKPRRPFGLSRGNSADESVIITISDDEDDDADDEMDTDNAPPRSKAPTSSFREAAPLRDFPQRPAFQTQVSGQSTPGWATPGGVTYEQKRQEIEEMKRMIAEKEKRKSANGKVPTAQKTGMAVSAIRSDAPSPAANGSGGSTPKVAGVPLTSRGGFDGLVQSGSQMRTTDHMAEPLVEVAPTSAATFARHEEKETLKQKLRDLQRDEIEDVNEAVEAAADEVGPIEETSANHAGTQVQVESTPVVLETQAENVMGDDPNILETEEGEISDDSLFNFYSPADAQGAPMGESDAGDEPNAGSQAPTVSDLSGDEDMTGPQQDADLQESQAVLDPIETPLPDSIPQDIDMADPHPNTGLQESQGLLDLPESLVETPLSGFVPQDTDMTEDVLYTPAPSEPAIEIEIERQDEDEESESVSEDSESDDDDSQDLDQRPKPQINAADANSIQDEGSDLSEADAGSEDDEPSSPALIEATPEMKDQVGKSATPAAESGATTTELAVKDAAPDDDLAPELQPATEEQAEIPNQVRQRTCPSSHTLITKHQAPDKPHFKPYESALRGFKDYKWHPDFLATTSQGFQSPTFSHKIDANKPLCPFEGAGGQCNDPTCQFQHFKDMGLTGAC